MYKIIPDYQPLPKDNEVLNESLMAFNEHFLGERGRPLSIFLKDDHSVIHGGVVAWVHSDSIHIDTLWVNDNLRGQGFGKKLLQTAEDESRKAGCYFSTVNTMDYQAEGFYLKHGYNKICEFKNYIFEHTRIFLRKRL